MELIKDIKNLEQKVINWRRDLHKIPELGNNLPLTTAYLKKVLDEFGVEYRTDFPNDSSILVTIKGELDGKKCIALRADTDGLPMQEFLDLPFKSTNQNMHACGHDAHAAMMLGTIYALNQMKDKIRGTVKFLLQPGEETGSGAIDMIKGGALEGVDFILALHNGNTTDELDEGKIGVKYGSMMACMDKFTIKVIGKGTHGAYPYMGIDPITTSTHIISAIQDIVSREINAVDTAVISVCMVNSGTAFNIIPEEVEIIGTVRAVSKEVRAYIAKRIGEISTNMAIAMRAKAEYEYSYGPPPVVNNKEIVDFAKQSAVNALGKENVQVLEKPILAGEDFAYYLEETKGAYVFLKNPLYVDGVAYPHHNVKFGLNEKYFINGVKFFVQAVNDYLK